MEGDRLTGHLPLATTDFQAEKQLFLSVSGFMTKDTHERADSLMTAILDSSYTQVRRNASHQWSRDGRDPSVPLRQWPLFPIALWTGGSR